MSTKKSMSIGLVHEMIVTLKKEGFTAEMAERIQKNSELAWSIVKLVSGSKLELKPRLTESQLFWKNLYKKYFNLDIDASLIKERKGKWTIFIAKGLTIEQVYDTLPFAKWKCVDGDLDTAFPTNDRTSNKDYVVYVDQNIEADEEFKNKSANDLKKMNHTGITILERLVLGLKYTEKTGKHLDVDNITLCSGSCDSDGDVPNVNWGGDELRVYWFGISDSFDNLRSREVVS